MLQVSVINASLCWSLGGLQHLRKCCCQTRLGLGPCRTRSRGVLTQHKAELLLSCCSLPGSPGSIGGEGSSRCGREADSAARTSKSQSHFWLRSNIRFPNQINPCFCYVSSCLTFSSIPPFRTGSGSGPAGMGEDTRISDQTPKNTTCCLFRTKGVLSELYHQSSTVLDQESVRSSPFIPPTPTYSVT